MSNWLEDSPRTGRSTYEQLTAACDSLFAAVIFGVPLMLGGNHPLARLAYTLLVGLLAVLWMLRRALYAEESPRLNRTALCLFGAAIGLVTVQLVPLPGLGLIAPNRAELMPLWNDAATPASLGAWERISVHPAATRGGLVMLITHALLFFVVLDRTRTRADVLRLLRWCGLSAMLLAALALAQLACGNGKFLWVYAHPYRDTFGAARGPFPNENHLAHFLALGLGPLLAWLCAALHTKQSRGEPHPRSAVWLPAGGLILVLIAGLFTFSRGGVLMLLLAGTTTAVLLAVRGLLNRRALAALGLAGVAAAAAIFLYGYEPLAAQLATFGAGSLEALDTGDRLALWQADLRALAAYGPLGAGVGSHAEVYPTFYEHVSRVEFTHAESGYVQVLLETGWPGMLLLISGMGLIAWWAVRAYRRASKPHDSMIAAALAASLLVSAAHAVFDFAWYIPGCMAITVILLGCLARAQAGYVEQKALASPTMNVQPLRLAIACLLALVAAGMTLNRLGPARAAPYWEEYLSLSLAADDSAPADWRRRGRRAALGEIDGSSPAVLQRMRELLEEAAARDPEHPRYRLRLGQLALRQFEAQQLASENAMSLADIRDAALAAGFANREAQEAWLSRAIGPNRPLLDTARRELHAAVHLCPAQGGAYALLAQLAFLDGRRRPEQQALLRQSLALRPYDGDVLLAAGREAARAGELETSLAHLQTAFTRGPRVQKQIVELLAHALPAEAFLETFQPETEGLRLLWQKHRELGSEEQTAVAGRAYVAALTREAEAASGTEAGALWNRAMHVHHTLADAAAALAAARNAVAAAPNHYEHHAALAQRLSVSGHIAEAEAEWQWCLRRRPNDPQVREKLASLARVRYSTEGVPR